MQTPPIILVPGFWLGAWAWDEVAELLRADGHRVTALTLPGLESADADRSGVRLADHVAEITEAVTDAGDAGEPVVLVVHSGAASPGYGASDRAADDIAAMVYVDSFPSKGAMDPEFEGDEMPMPSWEKMAEDPGNSIEGISEAQLEAWRDRAVPEPAAALRDAPILNSDARLDVPSYIICTTYTPQQYKEYLDTGAEWIEGLRELRNVTYIELPTSHWPMFSKPKELAEIIGNVAKAHATEG